MNWDVWGAPFAVLAVGVVVGLVLALRSTGQGRRDPKAELNAKKDALIDQLRSLRADRVKLSEDEFDERWARLLDAAARALRDIEEWRDPDAVEPVVDGPSSGGRWPRRAAWAVVVTVFFAGLGVTLQTASHERQEGATMTGGDLVSGSPLSKTIAELEARVQADGQDIDALNQLSYIAINAGDLGAAMGWLDKARAVAPDDPEVRTHMAILQASVGMGSRAKTELDAVLAEVPTLSKALLWKGLIALQSGEREAAVSALESALEHATDGESRYMATQALAEARKPPPTVKLRGSIILDEGATRPKGGVLFVMVRRSETAAGPPVAAVRLDPRGVPGTFVVTDRDLMMGGPWPEQVWIEARLDADGDPSTKGASDLRTERLGPFDAGAENVALILSGGTPVGAAATHASGSIRWGDGVTPAETGAVFVIIRRTPTPAGPPVAALRLKPSAVPGPFAATDSDIMMGGPWPEEVWIQARADSDANAMTKEADAAQSAVIGPISQGATGIELILQEP